MLNEKQKESRRSQGSQQIITQTLSYIGFASTELRAALRSLQAVLLGPLSKELRRSAHQVDNKGC